MKEKQKNKNKVFRLLCLIFYVICVAVLIVEASLNGKVSAGQSNAVGGSLADILNELGGDQTTTVKPTSLVIDNKVETVNIGDQQEIKVTIEPENATYKAVNYISSNEDVAIVSPDGVVTYLQEGEVTIKVVNDQYSDIYDSFTVSVNEVIVSDFALNINAPYEDEAYKIYLNDMSHYVSCDIYPQNTTNKEIVYSLDTSKYISISEKGNITPLYYEKNNITTITATVGHISKEIKVSVEIDEILLTNISYTNATLQIYPGQSISPKITFTPVDATYKNYKIKTSDSSIVSVNSTSYKGVKKGKATITIYSVDYPEISTSFEVSVLESPIVTDFSASISKELLVDANTKINISNVQPKYASTSSIKYESLTPSIASVDKNGKVTALKVGNAKVKIYNNENSFSAKTVEFKVIPRSSNGDYTTDFDIDYKQGKNVAIYSNQSIDLTQYYGIKKFYYTNSVATTNKDYSFTIAEDNRTNATLNGNVLTVNEPGHLYLNITHNISNISKQVNLTIIDDFELSYPSNSMFVNEEMEVSVNGVNNEHQSYYISLKDTTIATLNEENGKHTISANNNGVIDIIVYPIYDGVTYETLGKTYSISINHRYTDFVECKIYDGNDNELLTENNTIVLYVNEKYHLSPSSNENATIVEYQYLSSDESKIHINLDGTLIVNDCGNVTITIMDKFSNNNKIINVIAKNIILVNNQEPISYLGKYMEYKDGVYTLVNGHSAKVGINFDDSSTYTNVTYSTSNDEILSVSKDGIITPHKEGKVTVTMICNDGLGEKITYEITIKVKRQELIKDLSAFFYQVRKGLGHFGAFLVLGIFSTFTYLLYLRNKKWIFSVPLNIAAGFIVAAITEIIQLYVPGRYGSFKDVMIDFSGFLCSSITLTVIILLSSLIKYLKNRKNSLS